MTQRTTTKNALLICLLRGSAMAIAMIVIIAGFDGMATGADTAPARRPRTIDPNPLRYGILNALNDVDREDAQVAIKMNFQRLNTTFDPNFDVTLDFYTDPQSAARHIQQERLHALSTTGTGFIELRRLVPVDPLFVTSRNADSPLEPFVIVTRRNVTLKTLAAMAQRRLMLETDNPRDIGRVWLETALHDSGLPTVAGLFTAIQSAQKPMRLVLPVFFGKAEACLLPKYAFDTMVELNPQIGSALHIVLESPGFVKNIVCAADYLAPSFIDKMVARLRDMHKTEGGRQIMLIFQIQRNFPYRSEYLVETERIFEKYLKIMKPEHQNN